MNPDEQSKPIPLGYVDFPEGREPIMPMMDKFVNYTFAKEKNWETARTISNIMYEDYLSKNPDTLVTTIEGKIDRVITQFEHFKTLSTEPKKQDVNIASTNLVNGKENRQSDFQEWQINPNPALPIEIRGLEYVGFSVSRGKEMEGVKVQQLWLLADGAKNQGLLQGKSAMNYSLKSDQTGEPYPNGPNLMFVNLKELAKEQTRAGELAGILLGNIHSSEDLVLKDVIDHLKTSASEFRTDKEVSMMYSAIVEERRKAEEKGIEKGIEITAKNLLNEGVPIEVILKVTGLTLEQIEELGK